MDREQLLTLALELPPEQRAELAGRLIESLDPLPEEDVEEAWSEEIRRRLESLHSGTATTISFAESRRRVRIAAGLESDI
ncbi:MAG TPA: addiction module protein [Chloroflexota bacterium]|nr:addiction module protein [Chloroflexota bacterium]